MTRVTLLEQLAAFTERCIADLRLPAQMQEEDEMSPPFRVPAVYYPCLPDLHLYAQYAPFITHEVVTSQDGAEQFPTGVKLRKSTAVVRTCFCVYHENEQEGRLSLLTVMERLRIALLEKCVVGDQFRLDLDAGVETLVYPGNPSQTAVSPFYLGEMITTWKLPIIERKVPNGKNQADYRGSGYPAGPGGRV